MRLTGASHVTELTVSTRKGGRKNQKTPRVDANEITIMRNDTTIDTGTAITITAMMGDVSRDSAAAIKINIDDNMKYEIRYDRTPKDSLRKHIQTYLSLAAVDIEVPLELA